MNGVCIKRNLQPCLKLPNRTTIEILNGQFDVRNIKLLDVKKGLIVGGHSHFFVEGKYVLSGAISYELEGWVEGLSHETILAGDLMILKPGIKHTATFLEDTVILDFSSVGFIDSNFNNQP